MLKVVSLIFAAGFSVVTLMTARSTYLNWDEYGRREPFPWKHFLDNTIAGIITGAAAVYIYNL